MEIVLNRRLAARRVKKFEFVEKESEPAPLDPPQGFEEFLKNNSLSGDASAVEMVFLKNLKFNGRQPTALYYYRELQNLRDPLHFHPAEMAVRRRAARKESILEVR